MAVVFPTLGQVRQRVRFFIDEPQQANFTDSDLNWAINAAQQEVATEISLVDEAYFVDPTPTVVTTVANQRFYPLNETVWKIIRMEDVATGLKLNFKRFADQDSFYAEGSPPIVALDQVGYTVSIIGNSLAFSPTPTVAGTQAQYWFVPMLEDLADDADQTVIPRNFVDLLAMQAAIDAGIKDENDTAALERRYARRFNQLVRGSRDRQQQNPRGVTRVGDSNIGVF